MAVPSIDAKARKLSVIIPVRNGARTIGVQLEALARQQWPGPWEVIIADNGSRDDTLAIVNRYTHRLPNLRVLDASVRRGATYALNTAMQAATGDALLFTDADDEVGDGWLAAMAEGLAKHDFVACRIDATRLNPPWLAKLKGLSQVDGLRTLSFGHNLYYAGGGTIGVKRSLLVAAGGFDESLDGQEDTMLCIQLQLAGTEIHFVPDAVIHIRLRETLSATFGQAYSWATAMPRLYMRSVALGVPRINHPWRNGIRGWHGLLDMLPAVRNKAMRYSFIWRLGWQLGLLKGNIKNRVVYF